MKQAQEHQTTPNRGGSTQDDCIEICRACAKSCLEMVDHCLKKGGEHADPNHIRLLLDCADACETSAAFMMRKSDLHGLFCRACAEVCRRCAEDCRRFQDDETMRQCAELCDRCSESCAEMASR